MEKEELIRQALEQATLEQLVRVRTRLESYFFKQGQPNLKMNTIEECTQCSAQEEKANRALEAFQNGDFADPDLADLIDDLFVNKEGGGDHARNVG